MRKITTKLVLVLVLSTWIAPGAGVLAVSAHAALDQHGHQGDAEHLLEILAETASHGHHHQDAEATPDHDHEFTFKGPASNQQPSLVGLIVSGMTLGQTDLAVDSCSGDSWRRGPPIPLFTAHCALLL